MAAVTSDGAQVSIGAQDGIGTAGGRAPLEVGVVLDEAAGDEELILPPYLTPQDTE